MGAKVYAIIITAVTDQCMSKKVSRPDEVTGVCQKFGLGTVALATVAKLHSQLAYKSYTQEKELDS